MVKPVFADGYIKRSDNSLVQRVVKFIHLPGIDARSLLTYNRKEIL